MSKRLLALLTILVFFPIVAAVDVGPGLLAIPTSSASNVYSILDFTIENRGFDKVFVTLPSGWNIDESADEDSFSTYKGYPVKESGLWRIYGLPYDRTSYLGAHEAIPFLTGKVWTGQGVTQNPYITDSNQIGWWLYPNERLKVHIELSLPGSGTVDPTLLEEDYKWVRVTKWEQEFILKNSKGALSDGFYTAPWTVKGATLTSAYPAVYAEKDDMGSLGTRYWDDVTTTRTASSVPSWEEWFTLENSISTSLKSNNIATSTTIYEVPEEDTGKTPVPVWRIVSEPLIRYTYLWYRDKPVDTTLEGGVQFWRGREKRNIPAWYEWF